MSEEPQRLAREIEALPVADKLKLAAAMIESRQVKLSMARNVVRLALAELEATTAPTVPVLVETR
jgi:hypothetical protein